MFVTAHAPFALLSLATAAICGWLARYAWRQRTVAGAAEFGWLMVAIGWAALASAVEYTISAHTLPAKILANQLYIVGSASAALLLFLFAVRYTQRDRWLTRGWLVFLWSGVIAQVMLALTNQWHHLYWSSISANAPDAVATLVFTYSPLNRTMSAFTYGLLLAGGALLIQSALRTPGVYRKQGLIMILAVMIPVVTNLVYYTGVGPWPRVDFTPLSYGVSGMLMAWAVFRYQFLDLAPVAQDALFANLGDGVLAVNDHGLIVAANPAAQRLLGASERALIGTDAPTLPAPWGNAFAAARAGAGPEVAWADRSIAVACTPLVTHGNQLVGHILMLHDVTSHRRLEDELLRLNGELEARVVTRTAELQTSVAQLETEIGERQRVEMALHQMQESLADHIAGLSSHLSALYEVILLGGKSLDLEAVRRLTLETVTAALHADAGFLLNYLPTTQHFELGVQQGLTDAQVERLAREDAAWLIADAVPRTILHLPSAGDIPEAIRVPEMQACVLAAIFRMGTPVGALGVYWRESPSLSVEEIALFRALGDQLAVLAENVRLRQVREQALVQEERQRIARDLHDSVTQSLYALTLSADTARARLQRQAESGRIEGLDTLMERIATASNQALREIRLLLYELRLATPDAMPLAEALQLRLDAVEQRAGIDAQLTTTGDLKLPPPLAQALYWIAIEALNNALKHAAAQHVTVNIARRADAVELVVTDDGSGIEAHHSSGGFGLRSMAERAAQAGGSLTVRAATGGGAQVLVCLPISGEGRGANCEAG